ncbi:MAG TPA: AAC(3) family N-acetyltransferase [Dehalococcoidia bacterium]|nr:AAC(3) family N-acetyltransferase [Dehalococcoidia bacterium]
MTEESAIAASGAPVTVASLAEDLRRLGLPAGSVVLVHSSLSKLGWVCGGPGAVILALREVVGAEGTIVMPAHSGELSDPAGWENPPVPESWWEPIREGMPPFDPSLTATRQMGAIAELFRQQPGVLRSYHPNDSFAAQGRHAAAITEGHSLAYGLGEDSPLARVYELDGLVLLLGVGHGNNTSLHLAEHRADFTGKEQILHRAPMLVDGERRWVEFPDIDTNESDFVAIGADFARDGGPVTVGPVGAGQAMLMPQGAIVDYAVNWMEKHRS